MKNIKKLSETFPTKKDVIENTPDPAVRQMLNFMQEKGFETTFDRFDKQKPHCSFGLAGICCKNCNMGPCRITEKAQKGTCGADSDLIVSRNFLRAVAAGVAAHGARGREVMLALKAAADGKINIPIYGEDKIIKVAKSLNLFSESKTIPLMAGEIADVLLDDLSRTIPGPHKTLNTFAPPERIETWKKLGIIPISAYHEVFESLHRTGTGTDGSWESIMLQVLRTGLAFAWTSVLGSSIAMDCLYGPPVRGKIETNLGVLKDNYVNIALHGHSPVIVSSIVDAARKSVFIEKAIAEGAKGIRLYGICCSGLSAMYRKGGVYPLSNAIGAELVIATGALDLWVADMQDVFPSVASLADCFNTPIITTSDSGHLPGAEHIGFDHHHSNLEKVTAFGEQIVSRGIDSFVRREGRKTFIPDFSIDAETGFSAENTISAFGGPDKLLGLIKNGSIKGIVNLVGCNNPKVIYEKAVLTVADKLLSQNVLLLTNGCASFPLLKMGYCSSDGNGIGENLRKVLKQHAQGIPPVLHMGECLDNSRASAFFRIIADTAAKPIKAMPFAFSSPEWSNEKGIGAALSFRLMGINSYHCVDAPVQGSEKVETFLKEGTRELLGSVMVVIKEPGKLAEKILEDISIKRKDLGYNS